MPKHRHISRNLYHLNSFVSNGLLNPPALQRQMLQLPQTMAEQYAKARTRINFGHRAESSLAHVFFDDILDVKQLLDPSDVAVELCFPWSSAICPCTRLQCDRRRNSQHDQSSWIRPSQGSAVSPVAVGLQGHHVLLVLAPVQLVAVGGVLSNICTFFFHQCFISHSWICHGLDNITRNHIEIRSILWQIHNSRQCSSVKSS